MSWPAIRASPATSSRSAKGNHMAIRMKAADSFYSDATNPQHVHRGTGYTVETDALADTHEKSGQGVRVDPKGGAAPAVAGEGGQASKAPAAPISAASTKAEPAHKNKAEPKHKAK
jgi:hypothetical protein